MSFMELISDTGLFVNGEKLWEIVISQVVVLMK